MRRLIFCVPLIDDVVSKEISMEIPKPLAVVNSKKMMKIQLWLTLLLLLMREFLIKMLSQLTHTRFNVRNDRSNISKLLTNYLKINITVRYFWGINAYWTRWVFPISWYFPGITIVLHSSTAYGSDFPASLDFQKMITSTRLLGGQESSRFSQLAIILFISNILKLYT